MAQQKPKRGKPMARRRHMEVSTDGLLQWRKRNPEGEEKQMDGEKAETHDRTHDTVANEE